MLSLTIEVGPGDVIDRVCEDAVRMAGEFGVPARFRFNGVELAATPGCSAGQLVEAYNLGFPSAPPGGAADPKPLSMSAFAWLYRCDAEFEPESPDAKHWWFVWEPLDVDAPEDARPYCHGSNGVDFYDATGNRVLARRVRTHDMSHAFPLLLLLPDGVWREVLSGRCVYRAGRWHMRYLVADNTRAARMANAGMGAYRG